MNLFREILHFEYGTICPTAPKMYPQYTVYIVLPTYSMHHSNNFNYPADTSLPKAKDPIGAANISHYTIYERGSKKVCFRVHLVQDS